MRDVAFAVPGDLAALTGGYAYDRAVMAGLETLGHRVTHVALPDGFPSPTPDSIARALELLADVPTHAALIVDGLALGALPAEELARLKAPLVALVHHPLALETGLDAERAAALRASERAALAHAHAVIATSDHTGRLLVTAFGVPTAKLTVAPPGLDAAWHQLPEPQWNADDTTEAPTPLLVSVGSIVPRKGHDTLVEALAQLSDLNWHCDIIGATDRSAETVAQVTGAVTGAGLGDRIVLTGPLPTETIRERFRRARLFVLASHYEGFGMVFAEAMASGLPVVGCTGGAVPDVVPPSAGRLVTPGDADGLAAALRDLLTDDGLHADLSAGAMLRAADFGDWSTTSSRISAAVASLTNEGGGRSHG